MSGFGEMIYERRKQLRMTQQQLADMAGCGANYIGYLEREERKPSNELLKKLADVLGLNGAELFFTVHPELMGWLPASIAEAIKGVTK